MLSSLHIENVAVIKYADISFGRGFTVLSGETGAGKSIILDSISLLTGSRSSKDIIRTGESKAIVSGIFSDIPNTVLSDLSESGISPDEDGCIYVRRVVDSDGRSSTRINGASVPLSLQKKAIGLMISIHGQKNSNLLSDPTEQRRLLDEFSADSEYLNDYQNKYEKLTSIREEIKRVDTDESERLRRCEMLRYQISDIDSAKLKHGEEEELFERKQRIASAEKINKQVKIIVRALYRNDKGGSAYEYIERALSAISSLGEFYPESENDQKRLTEIQAMIEDIAERAKDLSVDISDDPDAELDKIESRLDLISKYKKKYGPSIEEIIKFRDHAADELAELEGADDTLTELRESERKAYDECRKAADELTAIRKRYASELEKLVVSELVDLDMPKVRFIVDVRSSELNQFGADEIEYLISANPGEDPRPLSNIASGGELSRIMLALKTVFSDKEKTSTIIYDEIDSGISGATSQKLGLKLKQCSEHAQIICVTHSAQIAALADTHYLVGKRVVGERTETSVTELDRTGRINEIARIMGGVKITEKILKGAEDLLNYGNNI